MVAKKRAFSFPPSPKWSDFSLVVNNKGPLATELPRAEPAATEADTPEDTGGPWSKADSPKRLCKLFKVSERTLKRRFADGTIRHKKLSDRSYMIHLDDLPAEE